MAFRFSLPILEYHCIAPKDKAASFSRAAVDPEAFSRQVAWLAEQGYRAITLRDIFAPFWKGSSESTSGSSSPFFSAFSAFRRCVVFTFDDGYFDLYEHARPILAAYGWVGTVFCIPGLLDETTHRIPPSFGAPLMSGEEIRALAVQGWEIGGHTLTHRRLPDLSEEAQQEEIREGKERLECLVGAPVVSFAYPEGLFTTMTLRLVEEAGFCCAVTTQKGNRHSLSERFRLRRVFMRPDTQGRKLAHRLSFGYDLHHRLRDWWREWRATKTVSADSCRAS